MEYYRISWSDTDALEKFFNKEHIRYDQIDDDKVLEYNDVALSKASDDEIIQELLNRDMTSDFIQELQLDKKEKKEIITCLCELNPGNVDDVISEIKEIWR